MSCSVESTNGCCSLLELSNFSYRTTSESILESLRSFYSSYIIEESDEEPRVFMATTRSNTQQNTEAALKELGFSSKKFKSRHKNIDLTGDLRFWWKSSPPPEIRKYIRQVRRELND